MIEVWKDIQGFSRYQVSNHGRVRSIGAKVTVLKARLLHGYWTVGLWLNGKRRNFRIHRLVAQAFIPNPDNKPCVNHKNGVKTDNLLENLEWCTNLENLTHARVQLGRGWGGSTNEDHPMCRLSNTDVLEIRRRVANGESSATLGAMYGVTKEYIRDLYNRRFRKTI